MIKKIDIIANKVLKISLKVFSVSIACVVISYIMRYSISLLLSVNVSILEDILLVISKILYIFVSKFLEPLTLMAFVISLNVTVISGVLKLFTWPLAKVYERYEIASNKNK